MGSVDDYGSAVIGQAANFGLVVMLLLGFAAVFAAAAWFFLRGWRQEAAARIKDKDDIERTLVSMADLLRSMDQHIRTQRQPNEVLRDMLDLLERSKARGP